MTCPNCSHASKVTDSRQCRDGIKRQRRCLSCGHRWATVEIDTERLSGFKLQKVAYDQMFAAVAAFRCAMGWK